MPSLAIAAVVGDVVALELGGRGFDDQRFPVVLPGAGFDVEGTTVDGVDLTAVGTAHAKPLPAHNVIHPVISSSMFC